MSNEHVPVMLALNGSERPHGNTAQVLRYVAGQVERRGVQFKVVSLASLNVRTCGACGDCNTRSQPCFVDDDIPALVATMVQSDAILYATPVHGFGMPAVMQSVIERAGVGHLRFRRPLANKVAGAIVVGRRYSHTEVIDQIYHNALLNRMILVGSGFPAILRTESGPAIADREGMAAVDAMIDRMIDMIWLLQAHANTDGETLRVRSVNERAG